MKIKKLIPLAFNNELTVYKLVQQLCGEEM